MNNRARDGSLLQLWHLDKPRKHFGVHSPQIQGTEPRWEIFTIPFIFKLRNHIVFIQVNDHERSYNLLVADKFEGVLLLLFVNDAIWLVRSMC